MNLNMMNQSNMAGNVASAYFTGMLEQKQSGLIAKSRKDYN